MFKGRVGVHTPSRDPSSTNAGLPGPGPGRPDPSQADDGLDFSHDVLEGRQNRLKTCPSAQWK